MPNVGLVIPCYNEANRFESEVVSRLLQEPRVKLFLVDDGSTDKTLERLDAFALTHSDRVEVLRIRENGGKAEAVRLGLNVALAAGSGIVGYLDADMATPPEEVLRLLKGLEGSSVQLVLGSRVRMLGAAMMRDPLRHYLGRVFATVASLSLGLAVYDTQCGAKVAKDHPSLRRALAVPFTSRWAFDVELIGRLLSDPLEPYRSDTFLEMPLRAWRDKPGSKVSPLAMSRALFDLLILGVKRRLSGP